MFERPLIEHPDVREIRQPGGDLREDPRRAPSGADVDRLPRSLVLAQEDLQSTPHGKATDPVFWVPLNHTISWLSKSF